MNLLHKYLLVIIIIISNFKVEAATFTATTTGKWNTGSTWVGGVAPSASIDSIVIPAGITVYVDGTRTCKAIKITGANAKLDVGNSANGGYPNILTATNLYIDEGGTVFQNDDYRYVSMTFTNVYIGVNNVTNVTSSFILNKATNNGLELIISGTLQVGLCSGQGSALFNYSPNLYGNGHSNTLTIANRIIYPNGTYTYGCYGGYCTTAPTTVTKMPCIRTWNGGGGDNNFSTAANWGGTTPTGGEDLVFAGSTRLSPSNDITAGTSFNSIKFSSGAGNFSLSGNSMTIKGGDTAVIANNTTGTMTIGNNITFSTLAPTITTTSGGTLAFSGTIANGGYLITNSSVGSTTFSGVISGTGAFTKSGAGTTTFSATNTYSGTATTISAGTLKLGASGVIPDASAVTVTGTLDMNTYSETVGSITGAGIIDNASGAGTPTLTCGGDGTSTTFSGIIKNTTGTLALTKTGSLNLTLQGNNTYSGLTTISAGLIVAENTNALGTISAGTTVASGAQLVLKASSFASEPLTITGTYDNGSYPQALRNSTSTSTLTFAGNIVLGGNANIGSSTSGDNFTITGVISGSYNLTTSGAGNIILSGINTYTGSTTIAAGKLKLGAAGVIPDGSAVTATGTFDLNSFSETVGSLAGAGTIDIVTAGGTPTLTCGGDGTSTTFSGTIKNTTGTLSVTKTGSGTQTFSGGSNITYTGASLIQVGALKLVNPTSFANGSSTASFDISTGATLEFNTTSNTYLGSTCTGGTVFTGTGTLKKTGTAALELGGLQGSSSYKVYLNMTDGTIDIQEGTLKNGGWQCGVWTNNKADLNIASGATLEVWDGNTIYVDALTGAGTLTKTDTYSSSNTVIIGANNGSGSFTGNITESSSSYKIVLTKQGSGTQSLSGTNTYSGGTNLSAGQINSNSTTALGTGTITISNGTVIDNTSGGSITLSNNNAQTWNGDFTFTGSNALNLGTGAVAMGSSLRTITTTASTLTVGGTISGTGGLTKAGAGTMTLGGIAANNWTGATTISAGTFNLGTQNSSDYYQSTSWTVNSGATLVSASGNIIINSAVMTINTGGTWNMNNKAEAIGYLAGGGNITNIGTSSTDGFEIDLPATGTGSDFSGVISGIGQVKIRGEQGSGKQIFSGLNTYTGQTLIQKGTLSINTIKSVSGGSSAIGAPTTSAAGTIDMGSSTSTGTLEYTGSAQITDRIINLAGTSGGATIDQSGTGLLKFTSNFTAASTAKTLTLQGSTAGTGEISGTIFSGSTNVSLAKSGSGTWTNSGTSSYNNVTVSAGTLAESANTVNVAGNFSNTSTFTPSTSTIIMSGTAAQTISAATFNNLTINNTTSPATSAATLTGNITVGGALTLTTGILNTSSYTITLGTSATISEVNPSATAPTSYVTGTVTTTRNTGSTSGTVTFGGLGVEITETTKTDNSTPVTRVTGTASIGRFGRTSILRYFDIAPSNDVALNGTLLFRYINDELNSQDETNFKLYKSSNSGSTWTQQDGSSVNTGSNTLTQSSITSFSRWTASNYVTSALPVEFVSFKANKTETGNLLIWKTAQETNNDYFDIERSHDGLDFEKISQLKGAGTTNSTTDYSYIDKGANQTLASYYRLKQVDFDKKFEYSNLVFINGESGHKDFHLYPNPLEEGTTLYACIGDDDEGLIKVSVFDITGKLLQDFLLDNIEKGSNITIENDSLLLKKGMYIIEIKSIHNDYKQKLEVK